MANMTGKDTPVGALPHGTTLIAAGQATARELLASRDPNIEQQSPFDRQARVRVQRSVLEIDRSAYLDFLASQAMSWTADEVSKLESIVKSMHDKYLEIDFPLQQPEVYLVKTSGLEQGFAAYTRHKNTIALPANMVAALESTFGFGDPLHPADNSGYLENVIIHETFHLFSKNNEERRRALYKLVHYEQFDGAVELPDTPWGEESAGARMPDLKITNPDTPLLNVYIRMKTPNSSGEPVEKSLLPVLLASRPYDGGVFFSYLQWWFMAIEQQADVWAPQLDDNGKPYMYKSEDLMDQYLDLIGRNLTGELFHPDEIMAQSFVLAVNQPSMKLLLDAQTKLRGV